MGKQTNVSGGASSLPAHSSLLRLASPLLATLLSPTTRPSTLLLPSTSRTVLPALLALLYTRQCRVGRAALEELATLGQALGLEAGPDPGTHPASLVRRKNGTKEPNRPLVPSSIQCTVWNLEPKA